jgi:hypothetical protein
VWIRGRTAAEPGEESCGGRRDSAGVTHAHLYIPSPDVARSPWSVDSANDKEPQISQIKKNKIREVSSTYLYLHLNGGGPGAAPHRCRPAGGAFFPSRRVTR